MSNAYYVYAIADRNSAVATMDAGMNDGLAMVPWRELIAVTRSRRQEDTPLTMEAVLDHERVVEKVRQLGPALPARFGTVFRDQRSLASALAEQYETLTADLRRLGDKVEMGLTGLWAEQQRHSASARARIETFIENDGAGARYLRARAEELTRDTALRDRARVVTRELDEVLGGLALDRRVSLLPTPRVVVRAAYLLDLAAVTAFGAAFEAIRTRQSEVRVLVTGPWPPYSFVRHTSN